MFAKTEELRSRLFRQCVAGVRPAVEQCQVCPLSGIIMRAMWCEMAVSATAEGRL